MILKWQVVRLELKETFKISYGSYAYREALIVSLSQSNQTGYGECTAIDYYQINLNDFESTLTKVCSSIENFTIDSPLQFYTFIEALQLPSFLRSALDCAYWDLFGKLENKSFLSLNDIVIKTLPESSITISIGTVEEQIEKINASKWNIFKVKCKHLNKENLTKLLSTPKKLALDSNGSFSKEDCIWLQNNEASKWFGYIEQPMEPNSFTSLQRDLQANWMADEDCQDNLSLKKLQPHYRSINIKLVKCGGLTPAMSMIREARKLGYQIMIGCMTESSIGISAGAVLAPLVDYADLDGANLLRNDIAKGSQIINGTIELSEKPGLGISLK